MQGGTGLAWLQAPFPFPLFTACARLFLPILLQSCSFRRFLLGRWLHPVLLLWLLRCHGSGCCTAQLPLLTQLWDRAGAGQNLGNGRYTEGGSPVSLLQKLNARAGADVRLPCVGRGRGWRCRGRLLVSKDWHCSEKDWHCSDKDWHCSDRRSVCERQCTLTLGRAQLTTRTDNHARVTHIEVIRTWVHPILSAANRAWGTIAKGRGCCTTPAIFGACIDCLH